MLLSFDPTIVASVCPPNDAIFSRKDAKTRSTATSVPRFTFDAVPLPRGRLSDPERLFYAQAKSCTGERSRGRFHPGEAATATVRTRRSPYGAAASVMLHHFFALLQLDLQDLQRRLAGVLGHVRARRSDHDLASRHRHVHFRTIGQGHVYGAIG